MLKGIVASKGNKNVIFGQIYNLDLNMYNSKIILNKSNDILVIKYTYIDLDTIMKQAKAIITETGGLLSHAAIVSREFGIPCIVGVKDITKKLKTGDKIELNLINGTIKIIK